MSTREEILAALRSHVRETYDRPSLDFPKTTFDDPVAQFIHTTTTTAGARLIEVKAGDDLNQLIRQAYPEATLIASHVAGIRADLDPDNVDEAQELERTDVGIVEGGVACAENGCVWIPQAMKERAVCFAAENLVIIVSRHDIVSNMHEAYQWIEAHADAFGTYAFGTFISGPSKTADIEQSLVYGAQAARAVTILLTDRQETST